jgi:2-polyprenyl-3-methyl-5-hydroxy-6-metoxy-1,4-benzoquinol methylase
MDYDKRYWNKATSFYTEWGLPWQALKNGYIPVIVELKKVLGDLRGKQILDHGCGTGKITRPLKSFSGAEVQGIDPSDKYNPRSQKGGSRWTV